MFERFTKRARQVVVLAQEESRTLRDTTVRPEHLLLAMLRDPECLAVRVMATRGVGADEVDAAVRRHRAERHPSPLDEADAAALRAIGIDLDEVLRSVEANLGGLPAPVSEPDLGRRGRPGRLGFDPASKKVLELALREAISLKHGWIGTEHLLLGLLRLDRGVASSALAELGLRHREVRAAVVEALRATG